jgi:hypothetical protein
MTEPPAAPGALFVLLPTTEGVAIVRSGHTTAQSGPYRNGETPGVRRYRIEATPTIRGDSAAYVLVDVPVEDTDARRLRTVSTTPDDRRRFVEVELTLDARRKLIEALGGMVGPDWDAP